MKYQDRFFIGKNRRPKTILHEGLNGKLLIAATPWGSSDPLKDFFETIEGFLSSALADADSTSPYGMLDCVDSLTNQLRVSLLLANERFYRSVNSVEYFSGIEVLILMQNNRQLSWAKVGGIGMALQNSQQKLNTISMSASLDMEFSKDRTLPQLPVDTVGLNSSCNLQFGSLLLQDSDQILLFSGVDVLRPLFCEESLNFDLNQVTQKIIKQEVNSSFWLAHVNPFN